MQKKALLSFFLCLALLFPAAAPAAPEAKELKNVLILRPDDNKHPFWVLFEEAMRAACADLGCTVASVAAGWDRYVMLEQLEKYLKENPKPDMVYFQSFKKNGPDIIKALEKHETDGFLINAGLDESQEDEMGKPREKYKHWVGQMLPDDYGAGYSTAKLLYEQAKKKNLMVDGKVYFAGIEGNSADGASIQRVKGLKTFVSEHPQDAELLQIVAGKWEVEPSRQMAKHMMERYPNARVLWAAGDPVAKGVMLAVEDVGKVSGKDYLTAGVDWADYALEALKAGKMEGDAGGHYMEGAWAVIVVHDYFHGLDFAKDGNASLFSKMGLLTAENVDLYTAKFGTGDLDNIDFKKLSKFENPEVKEYNFDMTTLF